MNLEDLTALQYEIARDTNPERAYDKVTLDRMEGENGIIRWAIRHGSISVFNKKTKTFEYEHMPSSRAADHHKTYRYDNVEEALEDASHIRWFPNEEKGDYGFKYVK